MPEEENLTSPGHLQEHIDLIAKHEQEFLERRTRTEKLGDRVAAFIGSLTYVSIHFLFLAGWVLWNTLPRTEGMHMDPFPFPFIDTIFAFEAILVSSFILMRQSRMSRRSEERDQLMLQILLLTEREITANLGLQREIAKEMGLHRAAHDPEVSQLSKQTSIDEVAQIINDSMPSEQ